MNKKALFSTGINTKRSFKLNLTLRISALAVRVSRYFGRSKARTGPYSTLNPERFHTSWAQTPAAPQLRKYDRMVLNHLEKFGHLDSVYEFQSVKSPLPSSAPDIDTFGI
jgi:hypothetical protein